jgi:hypothetical protein
MKRTNSKTRNSRWRGALPFVGLFIVFLTFAVKDGVRDWMKDAADSADAARTMFLVRSDIGSVHEDIASLSELIRDRLVTKNNGVSQGDLKHSIDMRLAKVPQEIMDVSSFVNDVGELAERSGQEEEYAPKKEKTFERLKDLDSDFGAITADQAKAPFELAELSRRADEIDMKLSSIKEDASVDFAFVYVKVITLAKRDEKIYRICTFVSWALYIAGWSLTFTGRLLHIEGAEGID